MRPLMLHIERVASITITNYNYVNCIKNAHTTHYIIITYGIVMYTLSYVEMHSDEFESYTDGVSSRGRQSAVTDVRRSAVADDELVITKLPAKSGS